MCRMDRTRSFTAVVTTEKGRMLVPLPFHPEAWGSKREHRAALEVEPEAAAFFDSLAQCYRRASLRWIDGTKRRPDVEPLASPR